MARGLQKWADQKSSRMSRDLIGPRARGRGSAAATAAGFLMSEAAVDIAAHVVRLINEAKLCASGGDKLTRLRSVEELLRSDTGAPLLHEYAPHVAEFKVRDE